MQPQINTLPLIAGESIIERQDISQLSAEQIESELEQIAPRLYQAQKALEVAQENNRQITAYAEQLLTKANQKSAKIPSGYGQTEKSHLRVVGGKDSVESLYRNYAGLVMPAITIDEAKLTNQLASFIRDDEVVGNFPVILEKTTVFNFDWDTLGEYDLPEPVIEPQIAHDPLAQANIKEAGKTEGEA